MERADFDFYNEYLITVRSWGILLTLVYFVYCLFDIRPAATYPIDALYRVMVWVQDIPVVGWIVAALAFLSAIVVIIVGLVALIAMIGTLFSRSKERNVEAHVVKE